jgi:hypothetical protein
MIDQRGALICVFGAVAAAVAAGLMLADAQSWPAALMAAGATFGTTVLAGHTLIKR